MSSRKIAHALGHVVSSRTALRVLKTAKFLHFAKRKPAQAIKKHHKTARLKFALKRATKNGYWKRVLFSVKKKFNLDGPDGYRCYWQDLRREPEVHSKRVSGGGSVMVWGGINWYGKTELVIFEGRQDSTKHQTTLRTALVPYMSKLVLETRVRKPIFQHDNASIQASRSTETFLSKETLTMMDWPTKSPDLNPIENVWGHLSRFVYAGGRQLDSREQLRKEIVLSWTQLEQTCIGVL